MSPPSWLLCVLLIACGRDAASPAPKDAGAVAAPATVRARPSAPERPAAAPQAERADASSPIDYTRAVRELGEHIYEVDAEMIGSYLDDPSPPRAARVVPWIEDGKPAGLKLYAIRPRSIPAALGLKNGDRVVAVNGHKLGGLDETLQAHERLMSAIRAGRTTIVLSIDRRGTPLRFTYHLVWSKAERPRKK